MGIQSAIPPSAKDVVRKVVEPLPDDCSFDEIEYRVYVARLLKDRIAEADDPATVFVTHDQVKRRMAKWLGS